MPGKLCNFHLTHDFDIDFFKVRFQIFIYYELLVKLMQSKKEVNQLDTGLTALPCPITTPMNMTFKFQIKACVSKMNAVAPAQFIFQMLTLIQSYLHRQSQYSTTWDR